MDQGRVGVFVPPPSAAGDWKVSAMHTTLAAHLNLRSYQCLSLSWGQAYTCCVGRDGTGQDAPWEAAVAPAGGSQGLHLRLHRPPSGPQLPDLGPLEATEGDVGIAGWPVTLALRGHQWTALSTRIIPQQAQVYSVGGAPIQAAQVIELG